ncbi:class I SAM-dependent methyltransferase [Ensifer adhaerens]|uniref:class I SAM-dependent methyltransferase n=1 Tax=Ensifer adhaerens TaxID=106592 RepID=UPI000CF124F2|nr:class I SAM-dependent methyltransferase [Ensifer adhaerens]
MTNFLYVNPDLYEAVYPDPPHRRGRMCEATFRRYLGRLPRNVLDLGCGTGREIQYLSSLGIACTGVDPSSAMINLARARAQASFHICPMQDLNLDIRFEGLLVLGNVLSHLVHPRDLEYGFEVIRKHAAHGAIVLVGALNYGALLMSSRMSTPSNIEVVDAAGDRLVGETSFCVDIKSQQSIRRRNWRRGDDIVATDRSVHRMLFPEELCHRLRQHGADILDVADNQEFAPSDFNGEEIYVVARF